MFNFQKKGLHMMQTTSRHYLATLALSLLLFFGTSIRADDLSEAAEAATKSKKCKTFCKLITNCLNATNITASCISTSSLFVNGVNITPITSAPCITILAQLCAAITVAGASGPAGVAGAIGAIGAIGAAGAAGAVGTPGIPGTAGIPGIGGLLAWGYVYNLSAQAVGTTQPTSSVTFDTNGNTFSGVTHAAGTPGSTDIVLTNPGVYKLSYSVTGNAVGLGEQFAFFANGVEIPGTRYASNVLAVGGVQDNGQVIVLLPAAGTVITLRNTSGLAITLPAAFLTAGNVNASVAVERIA
jgi:hypothetical protein